MDADARKTALRMIPYGLYVLTGRAGEEIAAATVNWVTQVSFAPPLVAVGVKVGSRAHDVVKASRAFALNVLGKGQQPLAFAFFKPAEVENGVISGEAYRLGHTGSPLLESAPAWVDCRLVETVERGDHSMFVGEVVDAGVARAPQGRPDDATLWLKDLGEKTFYGG